MKLIYGMAILTSTCLVFTRHVLMSRIVTRCTPGFGFDDI